MTQVTEARSLENAWQESLDLLLERTVDYLLEDEPHNEGIGEKIPIPENEPSKMSGYKKLAHGHVRRLIHEAVEDHEK